MIYSLSKILVRVPLLVIQIGMLYQLAVKWKKQGQSNLKAYLKSIVCVFVTTQLLHICSYGILAVINHNVSPGIGHYVDIMLGENMNNILIYIIFIGMKLYAERKTKQKFIFISLISCMFAVGQIIFYYYLFLSNPNGLTEKIIGIATICSLVVLFVHGAMLELMERIVENQKKQNLEEKKLLEKKYEYDYYLLAEEQTAAVKKIHEDMKKQLQAVQTLMESKDEEKKREAEKILGELEDEINHFGRVYYCDDAVLNTILSLKQEKAQKMGIEMDIKVESVIKTEADDIDLCSIVTNLLDNAIEATEKVKAAKKTTADTEDVKESRERSAAKENAKEQISVRVGQRGGYLMLQVENPILQAPVKNKKGHYVSSKKETNKIKEHGRGLRIVETNVEKTGGYLAFKEADGKVIVTAFIKEREETDFPKTI